MDPALEAVEDAFNAVFVAVAQHRILQRQPLLPRIGDKGLPAKTLAKIGDGVFLASDVGDVVAGFLDHPLLTVHSASTSTHSAGVTPSRFIERGRFTPSTGLCST